MARHGGGYADVVWTLLAHGAQVNERDENGLTPLHKACYRGSVEAVKVLLEHGHPVDERGGKCERSPLHIACEGGNIEVVATLLEHKHPVNVKDLFGVTPLHLACDTGSVGLVELLLLCGAFPDEKDQQGRTPLDKACNKGNVDIVKILLHCGARINGRSGISSLTPLHRACGSSELVKFLLGIGVSVTDVDGDGRMPLHVACMLGDAEVVKALLEHGAPVDFVDQYKRLTPLHLACHAGNVDVVQTLLENGANVNAFDAQNGTALNSSMYVCAEVLTSLLDYNCGVNVMCRCFICKQRRTVVACHYASLRREGNVSLVDVYERHIIKTQAAGVRDLIPHLQDSLSFVDWSLTKRNAFREVCLTELWRMKKEIVENTNITYFSVLHQNLSVLRNYRAIKILPPKDLRVKFPIYGNMIYCSYNNLPLRLSLLDQSSLFLNMSDLPRLPPECVLEVLNLLPSEDLKRLIQACKPPLKTTRYSVEMNPKPVPTKKSRCVIG